MGKTAGDEKLPVVFGVQLDRDMLSESRRAFAQINRNIQYGAVKDADQLGLGVLPFLEVQAPDNTVRGFRLVILNENSVNSGFPENLFVVGFKKITARVRKNTRLKNDDTLNVCLNKRHMSNPILNFRRADFAFCQLHQILTVTGFDHGLRLLFELFTRNESLDKGDFLQTRDFDSLAFFNGFNI